jgi:hypothetical protein
MQRHGCNDQKRGCRNETDEREAKTISDSMYHILTSTITAKLKDDPIGAKQNEADITE